MRLVQITDLHVGQEGEDTYGVDVRGNFLKIKEAIKSLQPDHIILSGDLCYQSGDKKIYEWIKDHLNELQIPFELISGNHDDPVLMAEVFERQNQLQGTELYFEKRIGKKVVFFLDTTVGVVSPTQLKWLKERLEANQQELMIFMHHPPITALVPYMDTNHALKNKKEICDILYQHPYNINIFTGHYHVEKTIRSKNIVVHITPSCFFQIDQHSEAFKVDHHRIGFREIIVQNGYLMNTVRYLP